MIGIVNKPNYGTEAHMARVVHFELPADDPERAIAFYEQAFGWKFEKWEGPLEY